MCYFFFGRTNPLEKKSSKHPSSHKHLQTLSLLLSAPLSHAGRINYRSVSAAICFTLRGSKHGGGEL